MRSGVRILIISVVLALASNATAVPVFFTLPMDGLQEAPDPGDADGTGTAFLSIESETLTIEWSIAVENIDLPTIGAHIHQAPVGVAGPIVVDFDNQLSGFGLTDPDLAGVLANPANYYVNVHNDPFPDGAVRGQLATEPPAPVIPVPPALGLVVFGLMGLLSRRRTV